MSGKAHVFGLDSGGVSALAHFLAVEVKTHVGAVLGDGQMVPLIGRPLHGHGDVESPFGASDFVSQPFIVGCANHEGARAVAEIEDTALASRQFEPCGNGEVGQPAHGSGRQFHV